MYKIKTVFAREKNIFNISSKQVNRDFYGYMTS